MGGFKDIVIDQAAKTMTVGGAVTFGDVYDPLYALGLESRMTSLYLLCFVMLTYSKQPALALASVSLVAH